MRLLPRFHWLFEDDLNALNRKANDNIKREAFRQEIKDDTGDLTSDIRMWYPWLSPGAVTALAKVGVDPRSPLVQQVADLEFQRRTEQDDWTRPGDVIGATGDLPTPKLFGEVKRAPETEEEGPEAG